MDMAVTVPGWLAAYDKATAEGLSQEVAIYEADKIIRLSQGAGAAKDQAAIMNQGEFARLFTMFYSYFSALYGRQRDMGHLAVSGEAGRSARLAFYVFLMAPIVDSLIRGDWPKDDEDGEEEGVTDDEIGRWVLRKITFGNMGSLPGIRDVTSYLDKGYGYSVSPAQRVAEDLMKSGGDIKGALDEDDETSEVVVKRTINSIGLIFKLPLGQPGQMAQAAYDVNAERVDPDGIVDWADFLSNGKIDRPGAEAED